MQDTLTLLSTAVRGMVIPMPVANPLAAMVRPEPLQLVFPQTFEARRNEADILAEIDDLLIL